MYKNRGFFGSKNWIAAELPNKWLILKYILGHSTVMLLRNKRHFSFIWQALKFCWQNNLDFLILDRKLYCTVYCTWSTSMEMETEVFLILCLPQPAAFSNLEKSIFSKKKLKIINCSILMFPILLFKIYEFLITGCLFGRWNIWKWIKNLFTHQSSPALNGCCQVKNKPFFLKDR